MKSILLPFFLFSFTVLSAQKDEITETKIQAKTNKVTVFLTGAELGHTADAKLKKGKNLVKFTGLSSKIDQSSIAVDLDNENVLILSVYCNNNFLTEMEKSPMIKVMRDTIVYLEDGMKKLVGKKETLVREKELLFKNDNSSWVDKDIEKLKAYADFCRKRRNEIDEELFKIEKQESRMKGQLILLNAQLKEINLSGGMPSSEVSVLVLANETTNVNFNFKYRVADAGWAPRYDIRVDGITKPVNLYYKANLYNNTGVDWDNVTLKLSTADPMQGAQYPKLEAWNLQNTKGNNASYQSAQQNISNLKQQNKTVNFTTVEVDELSAEFDIAQPYSIPSDSRPYLVDVNSKALGAKYEYISVPKMDKDAFLIAKVVGWSELSLVSGEASIYYNGSYIGKSKINVLEISDTLEISLGRDNKVAVTRVKKSELNDHQFIGNYEKEVFKYEMIVKNNRDVPVTLNIQDQVPVVTDSRVSISINEMSNGEYNKYNGDVNWNLALAPGESRTLTFNFSAKYPKDMKPTRKVFRTISSPSF